MAAVVSDPMDAADEAAASARRERHRSLSLALPEPESEPDLDVVLTTPAPDLRSEVELWRQQGERLLQRANRVIPTSTMVKLPAAFAEFIDALEAQVVQGTAVLAFEANPEALRCVLMWAVRVLDLPPIIRVVCAESHAHMLESTVAFVCCRMCGQSVRQHRSGVRGVTRAAI